MLNQNTNVIRKILKGMMSDITDEIMSLLRAGSLPFMFRAVVKEIIFDPLLLSEDDKFNLKRYLLDAYTIDTIPRNSIIATRTRTKGEVNYNPELFFPFFSSHLSLPIKSGEQVWIFYENPMENQEHGYWISRIHERRDVEDTNFTHADRKYFNPSGKKTVTQKLGLKKEKINPFSFPNGLENNQATFSLSAKENNKNPYDTIHKSSIASAHHTIEPVPRYTPRPGEMVLQGSNNTLISLGKKRISTTADDVAKDSQGSSESLGTIDIVVGRGNSLETSMKVATNTRNLKETDKTIESENILEGDQDFKNDSARIMLSMKASSDQDFNVALPQGDTLAADVINVNSSMIDKSSVVIKADQLRLIVREDIKISLLNENNQNTAAIIITSTGDIVMMPGKDGVLKLGGPDADKAIVCTGLPATRTGGIVTAAPIITNMGGAFAGTNVPIQGKYATNVLIK